MKMSHTKGERSHTRQVIGRRKCGPRAQGDTSDGAGKQSHNTLLEAFDMCES